MKQFLLRSRNSGQRKRGIALVATLFVALMVLALGVTFLGLSIGESRTNRSEKAAVMAQQMANTAFEITVNYMASPDTTNIWEPDTNSMFYRLRTHGYTTFRPGAFPVEPVNEQIQMAVSRTWYDGGSEPGLNGYYLYNNYIYPNRYIGKNKEYVGVMRVELRQHIYKDGTPPQYICCAIADVYPNTGGVYSQYNTSTGISGYKPLASRAVDVRFREKNVFDDSIYLENYRAFDMVGNLVAPPNSTDGTNDMAGIPENFRCDGNLVVDTKSGAGSFAPETAGSLRFFSLTGVQFTKGVSLASGANNVYPGGKTMADAEVSGMFGGSIDFNRSSKGLPSGESASNPSNNYMSNDLDGDGTAEEGKAAVLAKDSGAGYRSGFFNCGDNSGFDSNGDGSADSNDAGVIGHTAADDVDKWKETGADAMMANERPADVEFDGTQAYMVPKFAKFIVEFYDEDDGAGNGKVSIVKKSPFTGKYVDMLAGGGPTQFVPTDTTQPNDDAVKISINEFKNRVLYFQGGNVEVKGDVLGRFTVVAAEHPTREAYANKLTLTSGSEITQYSTRYQNSSSGLDSDYQVPGKVTGDGIDAATSIFQLFSKTGWAGDVATDPTTVYDPDTDLNSDYIYVSRDYNKTGMTDEEKLPDEADRFTWGKRPPYYIDSDNDGTRDRWVWPAAMDDPDAPDDITKSIDIALTVRNYDGNGYFNDWVREGNIIIGGNVEYSDKGNANCLGLVAKNYVLLSPDDLSEKKLSGETPSLAVDAAILTFDHSVQFDDVNMAEKTTWAVWDDMEGSFTFKGSLCGKFPDVEGYETNKAGYTNLYMKYDANLQYNTPPQFPWWDYSTMDPSVILNYVVLRYHDYQSLMVN